MWNAVFNSASYLVRAHEPMNHVARTHRRLLVRYCGLTRHEQCGAHVDVEQAIATLFENTSDAQSPQCVVIATEIGELMILSPKNFAPLVLDPKTGATKITLPSTPVFMSIQGKARTGTHDTYIQM